MRVIYALFATIAMFLLAMVLASESTPAVAHPPQASPTSTLAPQTQVDYILTPSAQEDDDDEPDVLLMALLTVGVAGGAAVLGLMGYVIRNRVGFWLHRPPPREGGAPEEHH